MEREDGSAERPLALIGARAVGKSTLGRLLAAALSRSFVDLDDALADTWAAQQEPPPAGPVRAGDVLARLPEREFRARELQALEDALAAGVGVLATGGGVVEIPAARRLLAASARVVWLRADPALCLARMARDATPRPPLEGRDAAAEYPAVLARRTPLYRALATFTLDVDHATPSELVARLVRLVG